MENKEEITIERKMGEIFEINGEWYQCVVGNGCENCAFNERKCYAIAYNRDPIGDCYADRRKDNKEVIFKKLERVGKSYNVGKKVFQLYKVFVKPYIFNAEYFTINTLDDSYISIEIKQTKEDKEENELIELLSEKVHNAWMKEKEAQGFSYGKEYDKEKKKHPDMLPYNELKEEVKEYDRATVKAVLQVQRELSADVNNLNLKPFDLEAAKSGKPVCTRDGRKARIVCLDAKCKLPIIALVTNSGGNETLIRCHSNGRVNSLVETHCDLMMFSEKKEGWINVYDADTTFCFVEGMVYNTKEEAIKHINPDNELIDTIKIEWEE